MKLPRNLSADALVKALAKLGYRVTRQKGSHLRLTVQSGGEHHITLPRHDPLRIGTLANVLSDVAAHFNMTREQLLHELFGTGS